MKKILKINKLWLAVIAVMAVFNSSCNEDFPNLLQDEYESQKLGTSLNKVLVVVVDGLRGNALTDLDPVNLRKISRNSLYSNTALGDFNNTVFTKEMGLANIFTGVTSLKHNVTNDLSTVKTAEYPTFFDHLKEADSGFESQAYTTNAILKENLFKGVTDAQVLSTDTEVLSKTKETLAKENVQMVVANFSDIEKVGKANSFESDDANYRQAILDFDTQMAELITALESRENYKQENWLVVITSSVGGEIEEVATGDETVFADNLRNIFTYFYSPRFTRKYQPKPSTNSIPFTGSGLLLAYGTAGNNATSARLTDVTKANFPSNQSFTITFFFKQSGTSDHNYPAILMKRQSESTGNGYQFLMSGGTVEFGANGIGKINSASVKDGKWHAITLSVNRSANTARMYTDGVFSSQTSAGTGNLTNDFPMIFGKSWGSNSGNFVVCNLQIYNVAMNDDEVRNYARLGLVKEDNSPFYNNLIGYWPAYDDVNTKVVTDVTGISGNLAISGEAAWSSFDEYVPYFRPDINESTFKLVPNQVDIPFFIYQWYGVLPKSEWKLDGQALTPPYAVLEY